MPPPKRSIAKPSIFRDFLSVLRKHWQSALPDVRPVEQSFGQVMPKASTFYAGIVRRLDMHVFIHFQHSTKAWQVGSFTINIVLSKRRGAPEIQGGPFAPDDGVSFSEGSYRIGSLLYRKDKWWHLKADSGRAGTEQWRADSYSNEDEVLRAAVDDVTRDVCAALSKVGVGVGG